MTIFELIQRVADLYPDNPEIYNAEIVIDPWITDRKYEVQSADVVNNNFVLFVERQ